MSACDKLTFDKLKEAGSKMSDDDALDLLRELSIGTIIGALAAKMHMEAKEENKRPMFEFGQNFGNVRIVMQGFTADLCDTYKEEGNSDG